MLETRRAGSLRTADGELPELYEQRNKIWPGAGEFNAADVGLSAGVGSSIGASVDALVACSTTVVVAAWLADDSRARSLVGTSAFGGPTPSGIVLELWKVDKTILLIQWNCAKKIL